MKNLSKSSAANGAGNVRPLRSRLNFLTKIWSGIWALLHSIFTFLFGHFWPFIGRVARYTPSSRPKTASKIKADLEIHKSSDDFWLSHSWGRRNGLREHPFERCKSTELLGLQNLIIRQRAPKKGQPLRTDPLLVAEGRKIGHAMLIFPPMCCGIYFMRSSVCFPLRSR